MYIYIYIYTYIYIYIYVNITHAYFLLIYNICKFLRGGPALGYDIVRRAEMRCTDIVMRYAKPLV